MRCVSYTHNRTVWTLWRWHPVGFDPSLPDFEASVITDYVSKFSPSPAAGSVQHLAEPPHHWLPDQVDLRGPVQSLRHGSRQEMFTINAFSLRLQALALHLTSTQNKSTSWKNTWKWYWHTYCSVTACDCAPSGFPPGAASAKEYICVKISRPR